MARLVDLTGNVYGRLTVLSRDGDMYGKVAWPCRCSCGTVLRVSGADLKSGNKSSCGCLKIETIGNLNRTHGLTNSDEYSIWRKIKDRCFNPNTRNYDDYGGRGISMCDRWRNSFENFYADMGPRPSPDHSIERRNNNEGYSPGNCIWATRVEQARNKRNNQLVQFNGKDVTIAELAELANLNYHLVYKRIVILGWSPEEAVA